MILCVHGVIRTYLVNDFILLGLEISINDRDEIHICRGMQEVEEIFCGDDLVSMLLCVLLQKIEEIFITDSHPQFVEEVGAVQIDGIPVGPVPAGIVNTAIDDAGGLVVIHPVSLPPVQRLGIQVLVKEFLAIGA